MSRQIVKKDSIVFLLLLSLCCSLAGCGGQSAGISHGNVLAQPVEMEVSPNEYAALGAGDALLINFLYWPEIGEIKQTIRLDGNISLPHIGRVKAEGLTPEQLTARLTELYKGLLKNPVISISVVSSASKRIYVGGEVWKPSTMSLTKNMSLLEAIIAAGGFRNSSAEVSNVVVIRQKGRNRYVSVIDLEDTVAGGASEPFFLAANDIIFVPRTRIDRINQWVEQYLTKIITVSGIGASFYPSDDYNIFIGGK